MTGGPTGTSTVCGGGGDDIIASSGSSNILFGGAGADAFLPFGSELGRSTVYGGLGDDHIDYAFLGGEVRVDLRRDVPAGPQPTDIVFGIENAYGSQGDDTMIGNQMANRLAGARGDDQLFGGSGNDQLSGFVDDDTLFGCDGRDTLSGNAGDDVLTGGKGADVLFGWRGADRFVFNTLSDVGANDRIMDFEVCTDVFVVGEVAADGAAPEVAFTVPANGVTIVVGDRSDPLFEIAVVTGGGTLTQADVQFDVLD